MSDRPWQDRVACRTACMTSRAWGATNGRLRQAMVDGAMQALEADEWCCSNSPSHAKRTAAHGARTRAESCGFSFIWISIALKLFEWFILPKILEWWKNR